MSRQGWAETLITSEANGAALTASTTATSLLPTGARFILPANWSDLGRMLRITASGQMSNIVTTPGTLTLQAAFGTIATPIQVFTTGTLQLSATAFTNVSWFLDLILTVRTIGTGTASTVMGSGIFSSASLVGGGSGAAGQTVPIGLMPLPNPGPPITSAAGYDSTVSNAVDLFGTFSLNNANSITCMQYALMALN